MQFAFSEDQQTLSETARKMLVERCTASDLGRLLEQGQAHDPKRLATMREMGMFAILAPEAHGGLGLRPIDFASIPEAAGYVALPEPLVEQAGVVIPLLACLRDDRGWLARAVRDAWVAVGAPGSPFVLDAESADALVLPHGNDIHLVERNSVRLVRQQSIDPLRRLFRVEWAPTKATCVGSGWQPALDLGALWTTGQLLGLAQRGVDLAVAYAKDRAQFGKPIGSYQAVKHLLASAQVKIEFARPVYQAAAAELGSGLAAAARVSHAKLAATAAADTAMRAALQVHGAMGFTWEAGLHFYLKRARVMRRITALPTGPAATFASEVVAG
jgi:alkylation response protein AidB-like acyl-CoA dehydrogenase